MIKICGLSAFQGIILASALSDSQPSRSEDENQSISSSQALLAIYLLRHNLLLPYRKRVGLNKYKRPLSALAQLIHLACSCQ